MKYEKKPIDDGLFIRPDHRIEADASFVCLKKAASFYSTTTSTVPYLESSSVEAFTVPLQEDDLQL